MIAGEVELDDLLATFATRVAQALGADRATLWLIDGATGEIRSQVATLPELPELRVPQGLRRRRARRGDGRAREHPRCEPRSEVGRGDRGEDRLSHDVDADGTDRAARADPRRAAGPEQDRRRSSRRATKSSCACSPSRSAARSTTIDAARRRLEPRPRAARPVQSRHRHVGRDGGRGLRDGRARAAQTDATVLLHGETGTGKGLLRARSTSTARGARRRSSTSIARRCRPRLRRERAVRPRARVRTPARTAG